MSKKLPEVDAYIAKSAPFAQPILKKVRTVVHKACPEIEEAIKWGTPTFVQQGIVAGMAAFKEHVSLVFWKGGLMTDPEGLFSDLGDKKMYTIKLTSVADLPADKVLTAYLQEAVELNEKGVRASAAKPGKAKPLDVPDDFMAALQKNKQALATFEGFSTTNRNEYVEWVTRAKRQATRDKRLATAVEWLAEGKPRNWKYTKKLS